ncbi:hypothetical protein [Rhodococcus sovatensis]|uniref:Transcriptional regulator n=1 Tax=Rhodococcus sovatensis TaxID=1805840 RepID=A0ABZ2PH07_9NOCA
MTLQSSTDLLVLHAVRLLGFADAAATAGFYDLDPQDTTRILLEGAGSGWLQYLDFDGLAGWSLTDEGRLENERRLADERKVADPDDEIGASYKAFLPLNARLVRACTDWQLGPTADGALRSTDHRDADWDDRILDELSDLYAALVPIVGRLTGVLNRFRGYDIRFCTALQRAHHGHRDWVDKTDVDSCHKVWFQLHEDLLATQGIDRRTEH